MLSDQDRIFTNLYGEHSPWIDGARARGDWSNTKDLILLGREAIVDQVKSPACAAVAGRDFPLA